ncbi:MAG: hypothetical protein Kow0077_25240 [Anaerolineae bacterium]
MATLKTRPTDASVQAFLERQNDPQRREDCFTLVKLMQEVTGEPPVMWGDSIVGFCRYHYRYASGREADWFLVGFAPRKQALTLYIMSGFTAYDALLETLGKYKTGKSCLYVKRLADVDQAALRELVQQSVEHMRRTNA